MFNLSDSSFWVTVLVAGVLGALVVEGVLWVIGRRGWARADMIVALGSLVTRRRENAFAVGLVIHLIASVLFAFVYAALMGKLGFTELPSSMMLGIGIGFVHGLVVSLGLVWVVAEQHPLEEYNEAGLAIGLSHLIAHVAFGAALGLVVGVSPI